MRWLIDCTEIAIPELPGLPPLPLPPAPGRSGPPLPAVAEASVPLVELDGRIATFPVYSWLGFDTAPRRALARLDVAERLLRAQRRLPADFDLIVIDAWRPLPFQSELLDHYRRTGEADPAGFVADPDDVHQVPPHVTGGAVDLTLGWRGAPLGLGTDFDAFVPAAATAAFETDGGDHRVRNLRRLLGRVLAEEGFVPDPLEWWHWSYGDQWWAARTGAPAALFGAVTHPDG
ncbi:D-alanyl-D-alanine dipeptidase [Actinomadura craniellae]|uniref:D-alanyl-D-alanine dipeptidase n=1 Tax=Actinomadura craniellae TaxID=2231787 RepID=A0A365H049_9ACTN|nr:M15 family metallopeptidase [Actinomadura craniellae]RAY12441.1 D-alanyl-D-alanine dipeptidase [Actinomadura craniellae]